MVTDKYGQELRPGTLIITSVSGYSSGRLSLGVVTKVDETVLENYYGEGQHRSTARIFITKVSYRPAYPSLRGRAPMAESISESKSRMENTNAMVVIQGPDCFTGMFPDIVREKILLLMAEHTR